VLIRQVLINLLQILRYQLQRNPELSDHQLKASQYKQTLQNLGVTVWYAGNGWLVKESLLSWLFFSSIDELESYVSLLSSRDSFVAQ
jgi:hypothetical protein